MRNILLEAAAGGTASAGQLRGIAHRLARGLCPTSGYHDRVAEILSELKEPIAGVSEAKRNAMILGFTSALEINPQSPTELCTQLAERGIDLAALREAALAAHAQAQVQAPVHNPGGSSSSSSSSAQPLPRAGAEG